MKHLNFVLVTPKTTRIVAAIELNDDLCRESQTVPRQQTLATLHRTRAANNLPILML